MPSKRELERYNTKNYFLDLARNYEKNEFYLAAAAIYKKYDPVKARKLYTKVARSAEMNGFYMIAIEAYKIAGKMKKAQELKNVYGKDPEIKILYALAKSAFDTPKPDRRYGPVNKFLFATTKYEREGNFEKAKKFWLKAAQYYERVGEFRFAALYYFRSGDLRNAKRLWKKAMD